MGQTAADDGSGGNTTESPMENWMNEHQRHVNHRIKAKPYTATTWERPWSNTEAVEIKTTALRFTLDSSSDDLLPDETVTDR